MYHMSLLSINADYPDMDEVLEFFMRRLLTNGLILIAVASLITFFVFGWDKRLAKRKEHHPKTRRIPEAILFLLALLGGALGALLGMKVWRHKTKHNSFRYGIPLILALQVIAMVLIFGLYLRMVI